VRSQAAGGWEHRLRGILDQAAGDIGSDCGDIGPGSGYMGWGCGGVGSEATGDMLSNSAHIPLARENYIFPLLVGYECFAYSIHSNTSPWKNNKLQWQVLVVNLRRFSCHF
jgi:hypothetical protein